MKNAWEWWCAAVCGLLLIIFAVLYSLLTLRSDTGRTIAQVYFAEMSEIEE